MKMFGKWFGRKNDENQEQPVPQENAEVAESKPEEIRAAGESSGKEGAENAASSLEAAGTVEAAEAENAEAEPQVNSGVDSGTPEAKRGGLKGMWDAARTIALTPVDPWFEKMADGLNKTRKNLLGQVSDLFRLHNKIDEDLWESLEDILLTADVGVSATERIMDDLRQAVKNKKLSEPQQLMGELREVIGNIISPAGEDPSRHQLNIQKGRLNVVMMVGVNGTGKTTSTAKLAARYKAQGYKVLLAAADTFRAAAIDQLQVWADRIGVDLVTHQEGSDPASVVFDAIVAAKARNCDIVFIDTAGRLHNKFNLMEELRKIRRVAGRDLEGSPHEVILVLDATTGQNAMEQARVFNQVTELTGLIMCKLDGSGKGGVIIGIAQELNIPVKFIGVGEAVDDMREFVPQQFLEALFSTKGGYNTEPEITEEHA